MLPFLEPRLPERFRALECTSFEAGAAGLRVVERPLVRPAAGEALVRMAAAPVNPSDLMALRGLYEGVRKTPPFTPGLEGAGTIVAVGSIALRPLVGRRVAVSAPEEGDGTWAEYMRTPAARCLPLLPSVDDERGAGLIVNPLTAWALLEMVEEGKHRAFVQTAAASQLGRMLLRLSLRRRIKGIHVVRREEQAKLLLSLGAENVLVTSSADFDLRAKEVCRALGATLAFDAVAGPLTGRILDALPRGGRVCVYGGLSEEACAGIDPRALIFQRKKVDGFWLSEWFKRTGVPGALVAAVRVQSLLASDLRSEVRTRVGLDGARDAVLGYAARMTDGKVLIRPDIR
jgi:NADPH:quinone reductase-like Zn-dependent oxidoreductase